MQRALALIAAVVLALSACAPAATKGTGTPAAAAPVEGVGYGTIVSVRPVIVGQDLLLRAVALAARPVADAAVEFIVREADGQIISVVQGNDKEFRPGERVALTGGARTRIVAAPPG